MRPTRCATRRPTFRTWNPTGSSSWNGRPWYFQYDARGQFGGDLNKADAHGFLPAMDRAAAIRRFHRDVVEKLRLSTTAPVNISHVFYYSYDSAGKSPKCDHVKNSRMQDFPGFCVDGVIHPPTGELLPDVAAAVAGPAP